MSKSSTIELLNETDRLSTRMDWALFKAEYALDPEKDHNNWAPGDPIHPWGVGNFVRAMAEEYSIELGFYETNVRCGACLVGWVGNEDCWMCGGPAWTEEDAYTTMLPAWLSDSLRRSPYIFRPGSADTYIWKASDPQPEDEWPSARRRVESEDV